MCFLTFFIFYFIEQRFQCSNHHVFLNLYQVIFISVIFLQIQLNSYNQNINYTIHHRISVTRGLYRNFYIKVFEIKLQHVHAFCESSPSRLQQLVVQYKQSRVHTPFFRSCANFLSNKKCHSFCIQRSSFTIFTTPPPKKKVLLL